MALSPAGRLCGVIDRIVSFLRLTRMALVYTAIADSLCAMLLWSRQRADAAGHANITLEPRCVAAMIVTSACLYAFGMSLNDIIDRRRDAQIAPDRPLPSGRIDPGAAHVICVLLAVMAGVAGAAYSIWSPSGWRSLLLLVGTGLLIVFYDMAAKYLVGLGLLSLGLIWFFHASIAAPHLPVLWQPLLLMNHITIVSAIAYWWGQKRPLLTRNHWRTAIGGLAGFDAVVIGMFLWRRRMETGGYRSAAELLSIGPGLVWPIAAVAVFAIWGTLIWRTRSSAREAGRRLLRGGMAWLIVYDACFVAGYVGWRPALIVAALLPAAYASVRVTRWSSRLAVLWHRPAFRRS
jgi:4-hydroxybenzoate polyprenyltransferase